MDKLGRKQFNKLGRNVNGLEDFCLNFSNCFQFIEQMSFKIY